jgi:hypothetical protein
MAAFATRAQSLAGPAGRSNTFIDRRVELKGTNTERRLMESFETLMLAGIDVVPDGYGPADIGDDILDRVSPFRVPVHEQLRDFIEQENAISRRNVMMPNEFIDNSVLFFVNEHKNLAARASRDRAQSPALLPHTAARARALLGSAPRLRRVS